MPAIAISSNGSYVVNAAGVQNTHGFDGTQVRPLQFQLFGTLEAKGTFGGGTLAWNISYDNGATYNPILDAASGSAVTSTAYANFNIQAALGPYFPLIQVVLSGATSPSLTVSYYTNRG